MKQSIKAIVDGLLMLAIAVLVVQWMITPRQSGRNHAMEEPEALEEAVTETLTDADLETAVQPEQIARMFGWRKRVAVVKSEPAAMDSAEEVPEEESPEVISYLRYIGYAVGSPGEETHFVKNTDTGQVVPLQMNAIHDGWTLIGVSETGVLVERDDTLYQILFAENR
jgi:hypothetical protein